jgi:hypothetical protein
MVVFKLADIDDFHAIADTIENYLLRLNQWHKDIDNS